MLAYRTLIGTRRRLEGAVTGAGETLPSQIEEPKGEKVAARYISWGSAVQIDQTGSNLAAAYVNELNGSFCFSAGCADRWMGHAHDKIVSWRRRGNLIETDQQAVRKAGPSVI
jgi:hypothetical protein